MIFNEGNYVDVNILIEKDSSAIATDMPETHVHAHHELYFLISGERRYFVGHKIYNVAPGNLVIIPKGEIHKTGAQGGKGYERYVLYFTEEAVEGFVNTVGEEALLRFLEGGCVQFTPERAARIREKLDAMYAENTSSDALSVGVQQSLLSDIIVTALRHGRTKSCATGEGADKIQLVAAYISESYASDITLSGASEMACMEKTYFSKRFKALTGFGFCEYLMRTRLNAAQELLLTTELNIGEISDACGFSGSNYFGDVFRRIYGVSPSEYRRRMEK